MQKETRAIEGDNWSKRTEQFFEDWEKNWPKSDPLAIDIIDQNNIISANTNLLEIGCGNGYRLKKFKERYNCNVQGIDCSKLAVKKARNNGIDAVCRDIMEWENKIKYDVVILGFFLYMCEDNELWEIGSKIDRMLKTHGTLIIYDFNARVETKAEYKHIQGEIIFKRNYKEMFTWNPLYKLVREKAYCEYPDKEKNPKDIKVTTLRKY